MPFGVFSGYELNKAHTARFMSGKKKTNQTGTFLRLLSRIAFMSLILLSIPYIQISVTLSLVFVNSLTSSS